MSALDILVDVETTIFLDNSFSEATRDQVEVGAGRLASGGSRCDKLLKQRLFDAPVVRCLTFVSARHFQPGYLLGQPCHQPRKSRMPPWFEVWRKLGSQFQYLAVPLCIHLGGWSE